jgi:hypothetical protein
MKFAITLDDLKAFAKDNGWLYLGTEIISHITSLCWLTTTGQKVQAGCTEEGTITVVSNSTAF